MYPFVNQMLMQPFQQIRGLLHFNDNQTMPVNDNTLHKVRLLVDIVKVTLLAFVRCGSELGYDEASVASLIVWVCPDLPQTDEELWKIPL
jgi:hypothetical protein